MHCRNSRAIENVTTVMAMINVVNVENVIMRSPEQVDCLPGSFFMAKSGFI